MEPDLNREGSFQIDQGPKNPNPKSSSDMMASSSVKGRVYSGSKGDLRPTDIQGAVQVALDYDKTFGEFKIYVCQCKNLAVVDGSKGRSDPYVKTYLIPDSTRLGKRKTSVRKRTVNPTFQEMLKYKIEKMALIDQKLNLSVWHNDLLGHNIFMGEIEIDLASWDWGNRKLNWYTLRPRHSL
ncbi:synaptotagmin-like protein 2 [Monodelphis domestica]|uniref:synaptotagmin-like protein 2 n=1 Tax=Monodelphis domestica TaxID=13616 RepID=UPI00028BDF96|nr:synaptotagmin-like protein 2 [Monodelphis domestica]XP_056665435.1 synaptotagmin-like protein 2 [Monodelphis domestica]XP_056665436.1 synaptotagmin-like protein 2 [Monodelphis domestica]